MFSHDFEYLKLLRRIMDTGTDGADRTGTGTRSIFGHQMKFDLSKGFPLLTTKRVHLRSIIIELFWFLRGDTNIKWLKENGVGIWDEWADKNGDLGPVYGKQWRNWIGPDGRPHDQISDLVELIKNNPTSRRQIVTAWNPGESDLMALTPCHCLFQTYVSNGKLSLQLYQRSCDTFLGVPFNIASYALLTHMLAHIADLEVGEFIWSGGDTHIYSNHFEQVGMQLSRHPRQSPKLEIVGNPKTLEDFSFESFKFIGYNPRPFISAPISV